MIRVPTVMVRMGRFLRQRAAAGPAPHIALMELLPRRVCHSEIKAIAADLADNCPEGVSDAEIGSLIVLLTDRVPTPNDVARVRDELERIESPCATGKSCRRGQCRRPQLDC